jgi:hypothetical protein
MGSANILATGATDATFAANNPHAGKWTVEASRYLGSVSYCNNILEYYLLADPMAMSLLTLVYLNGVENPTIESAQADFNQLGIQLRGYLDFGVGEADVRAAVQSSGK